MNKAFKRYNTRIEIPVTVVLETIFSDDNKDVESLSRWALKHGFVDLVKENENDKLGYYKLQDDYTKQSFYILLDKEERKQYDYENYLLDEIDKKDKEIERLNNIINELEKWLEYEANFWKQKQEKAIKNGWLEFGGKYNTTIIYENAINKLKKLKEGK